MSTRFSAVAFSITYCIVYIVVLAGNWPLFLYYPQVGIWSWGWQPQAGVGPAMVWYGLMAVAFAGALVGGLVLARPAAAISLRNAAWLFPCFSLFGCLYLMRAFFLA
jgi:hypothetical protein